MSATQSLPATVLTDYDTMRLDVGRSRSDLREMYNPSQDEQHQLDQRDRVPVHYV